MNKLALTLAGSMTLASGVAMAQEPASGLTRIDTKNIRYVGVVDAATGVLTPANSQRAAGPTLGDPIYANNSLPGTFYNIENTAGTGAGTVIIDEGRVPGTTSTNVLGTQDSYTLTSLQIAYVTNATDPSLGGTGITLELNIYENFAACGLLSSTDAPIATITLPGLAGSTTGNLAGQLLDVDLTGLNICLRADGGDGYSNGAGDLFGWSMQFVDNGDGTGGGPFIASQPDIDTPGDGTAFQNPGVAGSGLDTADLWRQNNPDGSFSCFFFGGYPANAFGSFYMVVRSDLAGDCIGCGLGDDRFEMNDDMMSAATVPLDTFSGLISDINDDFYMVTVPPSSALVAEIFFTNAISDLDLILIDSTGATIDTGFTTNDVEFAFAPNCDPVNSMDVFIRVDNFSDVCTEYDMSLALDPLFGDDALEDNDSCATGIAGPIGTTRNLIVRPYCGAGTTADDGDYYLYTLLPGETITVDALFDNSVADIDTVLYDISGGCNGSAVATGFSTDDNEHMEFTNAGAVDLDVAVRVDWFSGRSNVYDLIVKIGPDTIGELICLGEPNSVTNGARICTTGSDVASDNNVVFDVSDLPMNSMGYFIVSQDVNFVANPAGSQGNLCIASFAIGRYATSVLDSGMTGTVSFSPDLTVIPIAMGGGTGTSAAMAGDTYNHQYWYRDVDGMGGATSNFSDAVTITFN